MNKLLFPALATGLTLITSAQAASNNSSSVKPEFSLILDARYADYDKDPEEFEIPGFTLGGEAELPEDGLSFGHIELGASVEVANKFKGKLNAAIARHDGETELELEEAYLQTLGLGNGFTAKAGRFLTDVGRVNKQHNHAWDFIDAPLVYQGLWGAKYIDDGLGLSWIAPTDTYIEVGLNALAGSGFPAGGERPGGVGSSVLFANIGGDINASSSWQFGLSYHDADVLHREGGHGHGEEEHEDEHEEELHAGEEHEEHEGEEHGHGEATPSFTGSSKTVGLNAVYKWSPNGNPKNKHFILQAEYFTRDEEGEVELEGTDEASSLTADQSGYYIQGIYKFAPHWRAGLRYDRVKSNNRGGDEEVIEEAGLSNEGVTPKRYSAMVEWVPSEYRRVRLQFNQDKSSGETDNQVFLQFTQSFGAHAAHSF